MLGLDAVEASVPTAIGELRPTTGESVVAGVTALGLVVGFSTGDSSGDLLATGVGGEDAGALGEDAAGEDAGADGALAELYPVTEQPDFATSSAGQVTTSQSTLLVSVPELKGIYEDLTYLGLSAPCIQPQRKPQPGCSAVGNEEQVLEDGPPYLAPQTAEVAFHSVEHPSNCPNPPPGI